MNKRVAAAPVTLLVETQPRPADLAELYLDLMKKVLTRALVANGTERHTIWPRGVRSRLIQPLNSIAALLGMEIVKLTASSAEDYMESGHEATNRVEDAETMLGTRQLDHIQQCITDVLR
jgi:hypothetical protein